MATRLYQTFCYERLVKATKQITAVTAFFIALVLLSSSSYGNLCNEFDAGKLLNSADLVCHGRILSTSPSEIEEDVPTHPPIATKGRVARVKVLSIIKGSPIDHVDVVFRLSTDFVNYTQLTKGQDCLRFFRRVELVPLLAAIETRVPAVEPIHSVMNIKNKNTEQVPCYDNAISSLPTIFP